MHGEPLDNEAQQPDTAASLSDQRGSSFVQALILLAFLALGGLAAFKALGGGVADKSDCAAQAIAALGTGSGPCGAVAEAPGGESVPGTGSGAAGTSGPGGAPEPGAPPQPPTGTADQPDGDGQGGDGQGGDGQGGDGQGGDGQGGDGQAGDGQGGDGQGGDQPGGPDTKVGTRGNATGRNDSRKTTRDRSFGGAPDKSDEERENDARRKSGAADFEIGGEKTFVNEEGALADKEFAGGSEKISGGYGKATVNGVAKVSVREGASLGGRVEGKVSAVNLQGKHELPGGIQEKHEVDVLSVKGKLEGKAGVSKDVIGATVAGEAGANLAEAQIEATKVFKLPFTDAGIEIGGNGSAAAGANIGGEATAGYFKGEDGKRRLGVKAGGKAALGLGLGGKLSLNLVFG
jgi:hypothetical protein